MPQIYKKYVQNKKKKMAEQKLKDENQTGKITGQHSPDLHGTNTLNVTGLHQLHEHSSLPLNADQW